MSQCPPVAFGNSAGISVTEHCMEKSSDWVGLAAPQLVQRHLLLNILPSCSLLFPGEVVLLVPMPADGPADSWQLLPDGRAASPTTSFTQQDISDGIVWYRHSGAEVESDSFQFQVFLIISLKYHGAAL